MRAEPEDWRVRARTAGEVSLNKAAFHLAYAHGMTVEEIAEMASRGAEEGTTARAEYGPPKAMSDD